MFLPVLFVFLLIRSRLWRPTDRLFPSTRLSLVILVGIGVGTMMITRFNVSIAVLCMVDGDGDGGPPPASTSLGSPLEEGEWNKTGGAARGKMGNYARWEKRDM